MTLTAQPRRRSRVRLDARSLVIRVALAIVAVAAGTVLSLLRQSGPGALKTIWAEDGQIFLSEAVNLGADALFKSYAGYYHMIPRLLAAIAAQLPVEQAPAALAIAAAFVTALFALAVYGLSGEYLRSQAARLIVSVPVALVPLAHDDVPNSIANLHWTGLYLLFWLILCRPPTIAGKVLAVVGILLIVGSDILAGVYLPFVAFMVWFHRDRYAAIRAAAFGVALLWQISGLVTGDSEREGLEPNPVRWLTGYVLRAVPSALFGERLVGTTVTDVTLIFTLAAGMLIGAAVLTARRGFTRPQWILAGLAGANSVLLYAAPVALSGVATPRYAVAPALLLLVAIVVLLPPRRSERNLLWPFGGFIALILIVNFRLDGPRAEGPTWEDELGRARLACSISTSVDSVDLRIPPAMPEWSASLPCEYLGSN